MDNFASLDTHGGPVGIRIVEWNPNQLILSVCKFRDHPWKERTTIFCYFDTLLPHFGSLSDGNVWPTFDPLSSMLITIVNFPLTEIIKAITSDSKKLWQSTVLYHYCGLSQFFESDIILVERMTTKGNFGINWLLVSSPKFLQKKVAWCEGL